MIRTQKNAPAATATATDAQREVHNPTSHFTPPGDFRQDPTTENIIRLLRERETAGNGAWPGEGKEKPVTHYPNLAAEILAAQYSLCCPAEHANITEGLLADVLEAGAKLHFNETIRLAKLFGCNPDYLAAPVLQIVDPKRRRG